MQLSPSKKKTCAEVVVAVRSRSARYLHVEFSVGLLFMIGALAFMLFSPFEFSLFSIFVDPIVVGVIAGLLATQVDPLHRLLTPRSVREDQARVLAQSIFYERGVRHTSDHIGILVFFSLLERVVIVVTDSGVSRAIDDSVEWKKAIATIDRALADGGTGHDCAKPMHKLGSILEPLLPRSEFDVNELPNEVDS